MSFSSYCRKLLPFRGIKTVMPVKSLELLLRLAYSHACVEMALKTQVTFHRFPPSTHYSETAYSSVSADTSLCLLMVFVECIQWVSKVFSSTTSVSVFCFPPSANTELFPQRDISSQDSNHTDQGFWTWYWCKLLEKCYANPKVRYSPDWLKGGCYKAMQSQLHCLACDLVHFRSQCWSGREIRGLIIPH